MQARVKRQNLKKWVRKNAQCVAVRATDQPVLDKLKARPSLGEQWLGLHVDLDWPTSTGDAHKLSGKIARVRTKQSRRLGEHYKYLIRFDEKQQFEDGPAEIAWTRLVHLPHKFNNQAACRPSVPAAEPLLKKLKSAVGVKPDRSSSSSSNDKKNVEPSCKAESHQHAGTRAAPAPGAQPAKAVAPSQRPVIRPPPAAAAQASIRSREDNQIRDGLFRQMEQPSIRIPQLLATIDKIMGACVLGGKDYTKLINACGKTGLHEKATEILDSMYTAGVTPNAFHYSAAINSCAKKGEWKKAVGLLSDMRAKGIHPNIVCYNCAISACSKGHEFGRALELFEQLKQDKLTPTVVTYNAAISACAGHSSKQALSLLDQMQGAGLLPSVISYSSCISACEKDGDWTHALQLLHTMQHDAHLMPNVICYNAAISACSRAGLWEKALELLSVIRELRGVTADVITYNAVISACEKRGQSDQALELLKTMEKERVRPTVVTFNAVISTCEKAGEWHKASEVFEQMRQRAFEPDLITYSAMINAAGKGAELDVVLEFFESAKKLMNRISAAGDSGAVGSFATICWAVKEACARHGDIATAEKVRKYMDQNNVQELRPSATFKLNGGACSCTNGVVDSFEVTPGVESNALCSTMLSTLCEHTPYSYDFSALPALFLANPLNKWGQKVSKEESLMFHAEKKALAALLHAKAADIEIGINFRMCVDCHNAFKCASSYYDKSIVCKDGIQHEFIGGVCSCGDRWR